MHASGRWGNRGEGGAAVSATAGSTRGPSRTGERRARVIVGLLVVLGSAGLALLLFLLAPHHHRLTAAVDIELAVTAQEFSMLLQRDWVLPAELPDFPRLRAHLIVDSLLLVPGYAGLLVFFTLGLANRIGWGGPWPHALALPAVAAGLFDIVENGLTARAAEHLVSFGLSDAAVLDVRAASLLKWWLVALTCVLVGAMATGLARRRDATDGRRWLLAGGLLLLACGLGLALGCTWGTHWAGRPFPDAGALLLVPGLASLVVWRLRPAPPHALPAG